MGIAVVGTLTGVLAAVLPARGAARADVVAVLAGRSGVRATPLRVPLFGVALVGLGLVLAALGEGAGQALTSAKLILAGTVLVQIGAIVLTPAVVGLSGRLGRRLPLAPRLALRDAARHRGGRPLPSGPSWPRSPAAPPSRSTPSATSSAAARVLPTARHGSAVVQVVDRPTDAQAE